MLWQVNSSTCDISDEQKLQNDLQDRNRWRDGYKEILVVLVAVQRSSNDAKHRVDEKPESWNAEQNVVQVALLLATELQALNSEIF